jgi:hypothetical protein
MEDDITPMLVINLHGFHNRKDILSGINWPSIQAVTLFNETFFKSFEDGI